MMRILSIALHLYPWLTELEQSTFVDGIKGSVRDSV